MGLLPHGGSSRLRLRLQNTAELINPDSLIHPVTIVGVVMRKAHKTRVSAFVFVRIFCLGNADRCQTIRVLRHARFSPGLEVFLDHRFIQAHGVLQYPRDQNALPYKLPFTLPR